MLDIINLIPFISLGLFSGFLASPPIDRKPRRISFHKRGGMWFFRLGKLGGSFYLTSK